MRFTHKDIEAQVAKLNERLGTTDLYPHFAACYGGWRLDAANGTGFAHNNGTEARMATKAFAAYLDGLHDMLDYQS